MKSHLEQMWRNPKASWQMSDVQAVCRDYGAICSPPRGGGSHWKVMHPKLAAKLTIPVQRPKLATKLTIPAHQPTKPYYIHALVAFLHEIAELP